MTNLLSLFLIPLIYVVKLFNTYSHIKNSFEKGLITGATRRNIWKSIVLSDCISAFSISTLAVIGMYIIVSINPSMEMGLESIIDYVLFGFKTFIPMVTWFSVVNIIGILVYKADFDYKRVFSYITSILLIIAIYINTNFYRDSKVHEVFYKMLEGLIEIVFEPSIAVIVLLIILCTGSYFLGSILMKNLNIRTHSQL
ncbi:MAG: hypothetical protein GXZ08_09415 [Tissierellia bacterium]|nr:hypothetical protein [Tissierellia bacterium]